MAVTIIIVYSNKSNSHKRLNLPLLYVLCEYQISYFPPSTLAHMATVTKWDLNCCCNSINPNQILRRVQTIYLPQNITHEPRTH